MNEEQPLQLNRRNLLIGGGIGVGLLVGWAVWPRRYLPTMVPEKGEHIFGPWLKIAEDGKVIVAIPQSESGQGGYTALAQIVAGVVSNGRNHHDLVPQAAGGFNEATQNRPLAVAGDEGD